MRVFLWIGIPVLTAMAVLLSAFSRTNTHPANTTDTDNTIDRIILDNWAAAMGTSAADQHSLSEVDSQITFWAERVRSETSRELHKFRRSPGDYNNSEAYFRVLMMVTVLQQDCGVRYRAGETDPRDSRDLFLHGVLDPAHGGTCASMPVLYVAVGRKLGYPLKLVAAKAHLFARWDDGKERFNIEATNQGLNTFDDDYYKKWPLPMSASEEKYYLKSMTPDQEKATFLALRGDCLDANGRYAESLDAYTKASQLDPEFKPYLAAIADLRKKMTPKARVTNK